MQKKKVHLICNAHIDPVWLWEWEEGVVAAISTFRTAADLCEEFEGFIFNHNEAILYKWVEEYEPELFTRIQRLVKEGKWHIIGGWHLQPDCNMPSGESFIRQILAGKAYFKEKFGVEPTTAINFDPFGHTRGLVQILAKAGYDSYLFMRPGPSNMKLDDNQFVWVGYDGSEVLATRVPFYGTALGKARESVEARMKDFGDNDCNLVLWGVGNHGGGPSRKDLRDLKELISQNGEFQVLHSTPENYFSELKKKMDTLSRREKDLNPWAVGCYTSQIRIKQKHRLLENELYTLEKMASSAYLQGLMDYPKEEIDTALYDLLTCEFHDILPGSSIQQVEDMSIRILDHGLETVSRAKARAFFALASGQPKAAENEIPILVYNPHPFKVKTVIECEFQLADQNWTDSFTIARIYKGDQELPTQNEKEMSNLNLDWRKRVAFLAELEPGQMNRFDCRLEVVPNKPEPQLKEQNGRFVFDNGEMEVVVNAETGLVDKYSVGGVDYLKPEAFKPVVMDDNEDPWGMNVHSFRDFEGEFRLMSPEAGTKFSGVKSGVIPSVRVIEDGVVRTVIEAVFEYGHSAACQRYILPKEGTEIEVETRVHWEEKNKLLKLQVPVAYSDAKYIGQVAYGRDELPSNGNEAVAQKWTAVVANDGSLALTCINDGIYGSDFSEDGLRLTLLRSPAYSGHPIMDRPIVPQDRYLPRIDQGERLYRFWFNCGTAEDRLNKVDREALAKNEKPYTISFFPSDSGTAPKPFANLSDDTVLLSAAKMSEDGKDLTLRLFEPTGNERQTTVSLPFTDMSFKVKLKPFEIVTCRVDIKKKSVVFTDLMEGKETA